MSAAEEAYALLAKEAARTKYAAIRARRHIGTVNAIMYGISAPAG